MAAKKNQGAFPKTFPKGDYNPVGLVTVAGARGLACPTLAGEAATMLLADEPEGRTIPLPLGAAFPRIIWAFAATQSGVLVLHPNDAKLHLVATTGEVMATLSAPWLKHVQKLIPHPSGDEVIAVVDENSPGLPTLAKVLRLSLDGAWSTTELEARPYRPQVAFNQQGTLVSVDSGEARFYASGATSPTTVPLEPNAPITPMRLSFSGDRFACWYATTGGALLVYDRTGAKVQEVEGLLAERAKLVENGATLLLTAEAAKSRTGSADWVKWPCPEMREAYLSPFDVATLTPKGKLLPRAKAHTTGLAVIEGELVAVSSFGRSRKIELFAWSDLFG